MQFEIAQVASPPLNKVIISIFFFIFLLGVFLIFKVGASTLPRADVLLQFHPFAIAYRHRSETETGSHTPSSGVSRTTSKLRRSCIQVQHQHVMFHYRADYLCATPTVYHVLHCPAVSVQLSQKNNAKLDTDRFARQNQGIQVVRAPEASSPPSDSPDARTARQRNRVTR